MIVSGEVSAAIAKGGAVVALESTLIAHGLPWPANLETARDSEAAVRGSDAVPATIAVIDGVTRIGLDEGELRRLAEAPPGEVLKASRRDLASAIARGRSAATTVSATLRLARMAGIGAMATGGIGGVHPDAARSFDVSNDLDELARADGMALVCSGAKSILDLPATLELLETLGVPVVGYGTDTLPGFLVASTGLPLPGRVDTAGQAAAMVRAHRGLGLPGAIVFAQPPPADVAIDPEAMARALESAHRDAREAGISGPSTTPFLLDRIRRWTDGQALVANRALIVANARLAGELATALASDPA
ncbi:MAG: pseudouridine-5'-phosphate glycosidase [Isosphaeraceae bacterium]